MKMASDPEFRGPSADLREGDHVRHLSPSYHGKGVVHAIHPERGVGVTWSVDLGDPVQSWEHPGDLRKIGDTHHLGSDTADMFIAREIPVRPGVVMANRKVAGAPERLGDKVRKHLADWTKYDGEDPVAKTYGKPKPPSTKVSQPPKDWAKRLPAGDPSKKGGTWTQPPIAPKTTPKQ